LQEQQSLHLPSTSIAEFNLLNATMNGMVTRAEQDYAALKEFTGNAAHEMQTPLAVISGNTETLMQDESVLEKHHATISTIEEAAKRLSRLNQSLLLLAKIESRRFALNEQVAWETLIRKRLAELNGLAESQQLSITIQAVPVTTTFHQELASILVSNLLANAIRYNYAEGSVKVVLDANGLTVSNTSTLPPLDGNKVFGRFYRHPETRHEGNGLGLSIVQKLCKLAGYGLSYNYDDDQHVFSIRFS
jgi:signal transduction histidine kinase